MRDVVMGVGNENGEKNGPVFGGGQEVQFLKGKKKLAGGKGA